MPKRKKLYLNINNLLNDLKKEIISISNQYEKINMINFIRKKIHEVSPFKNEPVDFVEWVVNKNVEANDYNPNAVAPPGS